MKLLNKINRKYTSFSIAIFIVAIISLFLFMKYFIAEETAEKLELTKWDVIKNLNKGIKVEFAPFVEVKELTSSYNPDYEEINDTLIFNSDENDYDSFRQLKTIYSTKDKTYLIIVRTDNLKQSDLLFSIGFPLSIMLLITILVSNIMVRRINSSIWKPFYLNLEKLKKFSVEDKSGLSLINTDVDEFNDLNNSLIELTSKVSRDYKKLKEFSENASHELQTPIAIIKAKIEAILQDEKIDEQMITKLQTINNMANRLSKINKSLTILSKLESIEYAEKREISLNDFLQKKINDFREIAEAKNIVLEYKELENFKIIINEDLLELLLSNLFINAIKHNYEGGKIIINLKDSVLTIKNTGLPLGKDPEKMFERFEKGKSEKESSGLGLVIVKQICTLYKIKIEYTVQDEWHQIKLDFH